MTPEKIKALELARVKWRVQSARKHNDKIYLNVFPYLPTHAIHEILDELLTPAGWETHLAAVGDIVTARLSVFLDGKRRNRVDTAPIMEKRGAADEADPLTTASSRAFKRAALQLGIGRTCKAFGVRAAEIVWGGSSWQDVPDHARSAYSLGKIKAKQSGGQDIDLIVAWNPPRAWSGAQPPSDSRPSSGPPAGPSSAPPKNPAGNARSSVEYPQGAPDLSKRVDDIDPLLQKIPSSFDERRSLLADLIEYGRAVHLADWSRECLSNAQFPDGPKPADIRTFRNHDSINDWLGRKLLEVIEKHGAEVIELAKFRERQRSAPASMPGTEDDLPF